MTGGAIKAWEPIVDALSAARDIGIVLVDRDLRVARVSDMFVRLNARSAAEQVGLSIESLVPRVVLHALEGPLRHVLATGEPVFGVEIELAGATDESRWWLDHFLPLRENDAIAGVAIVVVDQTSRRRTFAALRQSEEQFRTICEMAPIGVFLTDATGSSLFSNHVNLAQMGITLEQSRGRGWEAAIHPEDRAAVRDAFYAATRSRQPYRGVNRYLHADGSIVIVDVKANGIYDGDTLLGYVGVAEDITEKRQLEAQLLQSQKLDSIGRLAGGIAHDFNNLLGVIQGQVTAVSRELASEPGHELLVERLREVELATSHAIDLTRHLLTFARHREVRPAVLDLNDVVTTIEPLLRRVLGENTELRLDLAGDLAIVRADPTQVEQVMMNLVANARAAMPNGGMLTITTRNHVIDSSRAIALGVPPGEYVELAVADTGCGIAESALPHIFEPFFTTRSASGGTGLGLATCYGIVRKSAGAITVESRAGAGATFHVFLPRIEVP